MYVAMAMRVTNLWSIDTWGLTCILGGKVVGKQVGTRVEVGRVRVGDVTK